MASQVLLLLLVPIVGTSAWRCAKYKDYFSQQPDYIDCFWDCCGNSFNRHCCAPTGIIIGCSIVAAIIVMFLMVLTVCWWQKRRVRYSGYRAPRLVHNPRNHSHYPVAPTSVTRPAPFLYEGKRTDLESKYKPDPQQDAPPGFRSNQESQPDYWPRPEKEKSLLREHYECQSGQPHIGFRQDRPPPRGPPPVAIRAPMDPPKTEAPSSQRDYSGARELDM